MFTSLNFKAAWEEWKQHKAEKHGTPYTATSESKALSALWIRSHGIEELAIASINNSIEHNWASIYIIKDYKHGQQQADPTVGETGFRTGISAEFNKRYGGR